MKKILAVLTCAFITHTFAMEDKNWNKEVQFVQQHLQQFQGWCCSEKAKKMMDLIYEVKPDICVEIGVFGGSSIFPTASALKFNQQGVVYAIDPWSNSCCTQGYEVDDPNYLWWDALDLEDILQDFKWQMSRFKLAKQCVVIRATSEVALANFADASIDILHIDGNHSDEMALQDATMYLPKVKQGGYIWFDDVNWLSTTRAVAYLLSHCILIESKCIDNACFLFQKL